MLEVVNAGFKEPGEARAEHPDVPCRRQVEHAEGTVLAVLFVGPDGDHGEGGTGAGVDPVCAGQWLLVGLGVQEWCCALAPALLEPLVEGRDQA